MAILALAVGLVGCTAEGAAVDLPLPAGDQTVVAEGIAFVPLTMTVPAGVAFTLTLDNRDDGVPHALDVVKGSGVGPPPLASAEAIIGPATTTLEVPPLAPGPYVFVCSIHPNMVVEVAAQG
jgi:plastocyanin